MNKARRSTLETIMNQLTGLKDLTEDVRDDEEAAYDNLPESIQESERGETMQEAVDTLYDCVDSFDELIDMISGLI